VKQDKEAQKQIKAIFSDDNPFRPDFPKYLKQPEKETESNIDKYENAIAQANTREELLDIQKQIKADKTLINTDLQVLDDIIRTALEDIDKPVDNQETETSENPYKDLEGYTDLKLEKEQETVFISFLNKLKEQKLIKEGSLGGLSKILGTEKQKLADIIKSYEDAEMRILIGLLKDDKVQVFIQKNLVQIQKSKDPETDSSKSGPQIPIQQENVDEFLKSTDEFLKEFYRKSYKIEQATAIDEVLKSLGKMVEDENLAKAAQRVPDKKEEPKPEEATAEEQPEQEKTISEQEEQKQASKDELRNLRIGMNSLLKRINYSRKALDRFKDTAGKGSVLASGDKKKFIKVLKEIQQSIRRIGLVLQQVLRDTEKLNEEESETIKEFREIQKKYDLASEAISNMVELLKPGGVSEIPKMLTNDAYSALVDLAIHFPSVAPFGAGKENRKDFNEYDVKFNSAIEKVKDDLQNVFSLMKTGQAGEESLILALDGIKEFSAQIQAIFGVTSEFEELKVDRNEEAAEGESKSDKDPEEEKYSDEISEEDKELITAAIQDHKEFYEKALETFRKLEAADPDKTTMSPEAAVNTGQSSFDLSSLNEIMKKTEDLIKSLNNSRKIAQNFMKRVKSGNASQRYQQELRKVLNRYINEYEKLNDTIRTRDFSSVLDTGEKRTEKVSKLIDVAKKYLDEKSAINNLFVAILNDDFGDEKDLEMIWKALKDADGKEAERLTGDMKYKVKRAGQNIKNIFKGKLDPSKLDFSSFKQFIGMVADKISKTSIKLRDKINEDEEQDVELEPNEQEEQSDEELKIYQDNLSNALKHMNSFVSLFASFNHAIEQIEKDVGRTKFLEVFDKEFSSVKGLLASMDNHLKKVSDMFGKTITVREAELYGFPPDDVVLGEPEAEPGNLEGEELELFKHINQSVESFFATEGIKFDDDKMYGDADTDTYDPKKATQSVKEEEEETDEYGKTKLEQKFANNDNYDPKKSTHIFKEEEEEEETDEYGKTKLEQKFAKLIDFFNDENSGYGYAGEQMFEAIESAVRVFKGNEGNKEENFKLAIRLFQKGNVIQHFKSKLDTALDKKGKEEKENVDDDFKLSADMEVNSESIQEQIATKLKPLIREMLNKGK